MNKLQMPIVALILCAAPYVFSEPVSIGIDVDKAAADMQANKYNETALAMGHHDESTELRFWDVDGGVLIASYSKTDRRITKLSYWFSDDRPKSQRQEFYFTVLNFNPDTGVMTLQTKKP